MGVILRYKDFLETYKTRGHRIKHLEDWKKYFPIKADPILAGIVADLMADGHLQGDPKWRIDFTSKSLKELKRFEEEINKIFEVQGKIRKCSTNKFGETYNFGINCSPLSRILYLCGTPAGQKVLIPFNIPKWIKKDKENFRKFCKRLFSCEGCIMHEPHRKLPQVRISMWKLEGLKEEINLIEELAIYLNRHFGIKSTCKRTKRQNVRKDGKITRENRMYITGKSVIKFQKEINFEGEKKIKLNQIMGVPYG